MEEQMITTTEESTNEVGLTIEDEDSGISTGVAMLIGSGLTLAVIAGGKFLKKKWDEHKAMKEEPEVVVDVDFKEENFCKEEKSDSKNEKKNPEEEKKED